MSSGGKQGTKQWETISHHGYFLSPTQHLYLILDLLMIQCGCTRAENLLLHSKYLEEQVTWIGGEGPAISFRDLVYASESHLPSLTNTLELLPSEEDSQDPRQDFPPTSSKLHRFCILFTAYSQSDPFSTHRFSILLSLQRPMSYSSQQ